MDGETPRIADIGEVIKELQRIDEAPAGLLAALELKADESAVAAFQILVGALAEHARLHLAEEHNRVAALRDRLEAGILAHVPHVAVNGDRTRRVPNTTNLTFDFVEGEGFVIAMDLRGIACSTGSACSSGSLEPSHVLSAIGLNPERARASSRFSLGRFNTEADVDTALRILPAVVEQLRAVSPHYKHGVRD